MVLVDTSGIKRDEKGRFAKGTYFAPWKGKRLSDAHRQKVSQANKRNPLLKQPKMYSAETWEKLKQARHEYMLKRWQDPAYRAKVKERGWSGKKHDLAINEECECLTAQGFKCVPIGLVSVPRPDIIAIKDGKIYAVEIERWKSKNLEKYHQCSFFDDIIWIIKER